MPLGPFAGTDMHAPGVFIADMPVGRPRVPPKPKIKGVPGPTGSNHPDYKPGSGTWRPL